MTGAIEVERMMVRLMGDNSSYRKMLREAEQQTSVTQRTIEFLGRKIEGIGNIMQSVGVKAAVMGGIISGVFGGIATMGLMAAGKFEQTTIAFETMLGSAGETKQLLDDLTMFAAETPFEMPEIESAARGLVQFGERGDELMKTLNILGNAAAGTSTDFGMVALIFNQIRGVGKLLTQDFRQLSTRGILSLQDIAKHFGVTTAAAQEMLSAGKVSFEDLKAILGSLSAEGGRFANLMERQSKSLLGLWSTLKDAIGILNREIGEVLAPHAKLVVEWLIKLVEVFRDLEPSIKKNIGMVVGFGAVLGTTLTTLGSLGMVVSVVSGGLMTLVSIMSAIISPVGLLTGAVLGLSYAFFNFTSYGAKSLEWFADQWKKFSDWLRPSIEAITMSLASGNWGLAAQIAMAQIEYAFEKGLLPVRLMWIGFTNLLKQTWSDVSFYIAEKISVITSKFQTMVAYLKMIFGAIKETVSFLMSGAFFGDGGKFKNAIDKIGSDLGNELDRIKRDTDKTKESLQDMKKAALEAINGDAVKDALDRVAKLFEKQKHLKDLFAQARSEWEKLNSGEKLKGPEVEIPPIGTLNVPVNFDMDNKAVMAGTAEFRKLMADTFANTKQQAVEGPSGPAQGPFNTGGLGPVQGAIPDSNLLPPSLDINKFPKPGVGGLGPVDPAIDFTIGTAAGPQPSALTQPMNPAYGGANSLAKSEIFLERIATAVETVAGKEGLELVPVDLE